MKFYISLFLLLSFSCFGQIEKDFVCAKQLNSNEIIEIKTGSFEDYSIEDLNLIAEITSYVHNCNPGNSYECFLNLRKPDLLILDIFGLEDLNAIDKTICGLKKIKKIKLPKETFILFHKYNDKLEDGGIFLGIKLK